MMMGNRLALLVAALLAVSALAAAQIENLPPSTRCTDATIQLPESSAKLVCEAVDADGFISTYRWNQVGGPASTYLSFARNEATVTGVRAAGRYQFEFVAIDNSGARSTAVATLTAVDPNGAPMNQPPTVSVGQDLVIRLPQSSVELVGTAFDPENRLRSASWREATSPRPATLSSTVNGRATASGLIAGSYVFAFEALDEEGEAASKRLSVTVLPAQEGELQVSAGPGGSVRMPAAGGLASATLYGSSIGSTGGVAWRQLAGPVQATVESPQSAVTNVKDLKQGVYVFELRARDASTGREVSSTCNLVVFGPGEAPVIDLAGTFRVKMPADSFTLAASVRDPDGTVASRQWAFLSGPATPTVEGRGDSADVRGLSLPGSYVFSLTVTDNDGLTSTARTTLAVLPQDAAPTVQLLVAPRIVVDPAANGTVTLAARASDPNGRLAGFVWEQLSGPEQLPMAAAVEGGVARATLAGPMAPGDYLFQVSASDETGRRATEVVTVQVLRENQAPLRAQDRIRAAVNLPARETTIQAKCYDEDGSVVNYSWRQVSGPSTATIEAQGDGSSAKVSGLVEGEYALLVSCVDDRGAAAATPVTLSVLQEALFPPRKLAYIVTLPMRSVNITYPVPSGFGTPGYVRWRFVSGPEERAANSQSLDLNLADLVPGTYVFEMSAVDERGRAAKDTVAVVVQADSGPPVEARVADGRLQAPAARLPRDASDFIVVQADGPARLDPASLRVRPGKPAAFLELGAPEAAAPGLYSFLVAAFAPDGSYDQETLRVNVAGALKAPTLEGMAAELAASAAKGDVGLSTRGARVDALGARGPFSYFWEQLAGPQGARLVDAHTGEARLEAPRPGLYRFRVTVRDADGNSDSRTVTLYVRGSFPWVSLFTAVGLGVAFVGDAVSPGPVLSTAVAGVSMHAALVHGSAHLAAPPAAHSEWFDFAHSFAWANLHFPAPWAGIRAGDPLSRAVHARRLQGVDEASLASDLTVEGYARIYFVGTCFWALLALLLAFVARVAGRALYPPLVRAWRGLSGEHAGEPVELPAGLHFPALELRVAEFAFFGVALAAVRALAVGDALALRVFAGAALALFPVAYLFLALSTYARVKREGHTERRPRSYLAIRLGGRAFRAAAEASSALGGAWGGAGAPSPPTTALLHCAAGRPANERDIARWFVSCPPLFAIGTTRPSLGRPAARAAAAGREKLLSDGPRSDAWEEEQAPGAAAAASDASAPLLWALPGELRILNIFAPLYVWGPRPRAPLPSAPGAPPAAPRNGPGSDPFYACLGGLYRCYKQVGQGAGQYGPARLLARLVIAVLALLLVPAAWLAVQCAFTRPCLLPYDNPLELISAAAGLAIPAAGASYLVGGPLTAGADAAGGLVTFTTFALVVRVIQAVLESGIITALVLRPLAALVAGLSLLLCGGAGISAGELHLTPEEMADCHYLVTTHVPPLRRSFDVFAAPVPRSPGFARRFLGHPGEISRGFALYQPAGAPQTVFCLYDPAKVSPEEIAGLVDRELQGQGTSEAFRPLHRAAAEAVDFSSAPAREASLGHPRAGSPALIYPAGQPGYAQPTLATPAYSGALASPARGPAELQASTSYRASSRGKQRPGASPGPAAAAEAASRALYNSGRVPGAAFPTDPRLLPRFGTLEEYFRALGKGGRAGTWRGAPARVYVQAFEGPLRAEHLAPARIAATLDAAVCQARTASPGFLRVYDFFALGAPDAPAALATVAEPYDLDLETYIRFAGFGDSAQRRHEVLRGAIAQVLLAMDAAVSARFEGGAFASQRMLGGAGDDGRSLQFVHGDLRPSNVALLLSRRMRAELAAQHARAGASPAHWKLGNKASAAFPGAYTALHGRPPPTGSTPYGPVAAQTGRLASPAGLADGGPDEAADLAAVLRAAEAQAEPLGAAARRYLVFVRGPTGPQRHREPPGGSFLGATGGSGTLYRPGHPYPSSPGEPGLLGPAGSTRALGALGSDPRECFLVDLDTAPLAKIMNMSAASSRVLGADGALSGETVQGPEAAPRLPPADGAHDLRTFAFHAFHLLAACEDSFGPLGPDLYDLLRSMGDPPAAGAPMPLEPAPRRFLRHRFFDPLRRPVPDSLHAATLPGGALLGYGSAAFFVEHATDRPLPPTPAPAASPSSGSFYGMGGEGGSGSVPPVRAVATYRREALAALAGKRAAVRGEALSITMGPEGETTSVRRIEGPAFAPAGPRPGPGLQQPLQPPPVQPERPYFAGPAPPPQPVKKKSKMARFFG
eukprot:tig00000237_g20468.t1